MQAEPVTENRTRTHLSIRETLLVGVALFTMFFGAGNLIFPPILAYQAGSTVSWAFAGFLISAIGLPVLGVIATAKAGRLPELAGNIGPRFSRAFTLLVVLAIGPMLAIPRTASTSFSMVAAPFVSGSTLTWVQAGYSIVFFAVAYLLARHPNRITDFLGRISGPVLLALIAVIVAGALLNPSPAAPITQASSEYATAPAVGGFLEGYQTMDALAALLFGAIIAMNIKRMGVTGESDIARTTTVAGIIMGIVEALVYCGLAFVGIWASGLVSAGSTDITGATVLTTAANALFGSAGVVIIGIIFVLACLNVCCGLLCTVAEHFSIEFPKISYSTWLIIFTAISLLLANFGLAAIIGISVPILDALYPIAIVLIIMGLGHRAVDRRPAVWKTVTGFTAAASLAFTVADIVWPAGGLTANPLAILPLADVGLGWIVFALLGLIIGIFIPTRTKASGRPGTNG
jgi:LIVCS family branched-chain amino acid:cation transporter